MIDNPQERHLLLEKLGRKNWFKSVNKKNLELLISAASNSVLTLLSVVDDDLDSKEIVNLLELVETNNLWIALFKVRYLSNNQTEVEEYVFPKETDNEMGKSIVLVRILGGKNYVVLNKDMKAINMKYPRFSDSKTIFLPTKLEKWLKECMKTKEVAVKNFIDLGVYRPYSELSTMQKPLFIVVVECTQFEPTNNTIFESIDTTNISIIIDSNSETATTIIAARLQSNNLL